MAELRSTENARCTITIRFVYEYATLYLLHAIGVRPSEWALKRDIKVEI